MDGFISYAHEDWALLEELKPTFQNIVLSKGLAFWDDTLLTGGQKWEPAINAAINRARYFVFLMSPHSIVSDFILRVEWPAMTARAVSAGALVIPVLLKHCLWTQRPEFKQLQVIPRRGKGPYAVQRWRPRNVGITEMEAQILTAVQTHQAGVTP